MTEGPYSDSDRNVAYAEGASDERIRLARRLEDETKTCDYNTAPANSPRYCPHCATMRDLAKWLRGGGR